MKRACDEVPTELIAARPRAPVEAATTAAEAPEEAVLTFGEGEGAGAAGGAALPHVVGTRSAPHPPRLNVLTFGDVPGELLGAYILPVLRWSDLVR